MRALVILLLLSLGAFSQQINTTLTYLVKKPAEITKKTPVMILLHGKGANERDLFTLAERLPPSMLYFSLRAPYKQGKDGYCWYQLSRGADHQFVYDYGEAKISAEKIIGFIRAACKAYGVDSTQVYLLGFSQGAIMSYEMALTYPGNIRGVVALSGRIMEETKQRQLNLKAGSYPAFFVAHGLSDSMITYDAGKEAHLFLEKNKFKSTFKTYEMAHTITSPELNDMRVWLSGLLTPASVKK